MTDEVLVVSRHRWFSHLWTNNTAWRITVYLAAAVAAGALSGLLWSWLTPLSAYTIQENMVASISERGQAQIVAADLVFTIITGLVGLAIGVAGWLVWHRKGWLVTTIPGVAAIGASLVAWRMGLLVGRTGFSERLAQARVGDVIPIDLQLRAMSALLVAPFTAIIPVMLLAAFWPEAAGEQPTEPPVRAD